MPTADRPVWICEAFRLDVIPSTVRVAVRLVDPRLQIDDLERLKAVESAVT